MKTPRERTALVGILGALLVTTPAYARCRIQNDTAHNFKVDSGDTYGQVLSAHSTTSIDSGDIVGQSTDSREFSASCEDGDALVVREYQGRIRVSRLERR